MDLSGQYLYKSNMENVQSYNLFGERSGLPDVVHCEAIETRSKLHNWEFQPHVHARLHQFLLLDQGDGTATLEGKAFTLREKSLVNVPTGIVHSFSFRPGSQGWVVTIAREVLDDTLKEAEGLNPVLSHPDVVPYSDRVRGIVENLFAEYAGLDFARAHILRGMSGVLAGLVARALTDKGLQARRSESSLQRRFEALIEETFKTHQPVADYAAQLAVTPTHLSRVMRKATGHPASFAIEERIIREARRYLAYSNLTVSEIAYQLGYSDPAYFSRVFSRATGSSPRQFRSEMHGKAAPG